MSSEKLISEWEIKMSLLMAQFGIGSPSLSITLCHNCFLVYVMLYQTSTLAALQLYKYEEKEGVLNKVGAFWCLFRKFYYTGGAIVRALSTFILQLVLKAWNFQEMIFGSKEMKFLTETLDIYVGDDVSNFLTEIYFLSSQITSYTVGKIILF